MAVSFNLKGSTKKTRDFLVKMQNENNFFSSLDALGQRGVAALVAATPVDSGLTASSWSYEIIRENGKVTVSWSNSNVNNGVNIAILIQYGHGTGSGGYVPGRDYINPAIKSIFDEIDADVWKRVTTA